MDWIRRNWPDLLIGMGLLAVIAGIVATLLTGGTIFPLGQERQPAPAPTSTANARQDSTPVPLPGQGTALSGDSTAGTASESTAASTVTVSGLPPISQPAGLADAQADNAGLPESAPVVALRPGDSAPAEQVPAQTPAQAEAQAAAQPPAQAAAQAQAAATAAAGQAAAAPAEGAEAPYRVSVGSFRNADNARRQAELFRQAGYPVFTATQGDLNLVLLGPYRLETEAERVRSAVAAGGFDVAPIIYTFQPEGQAAVTPAETPVQTPVQTPAPVTTTAPTPVLAPAGADSPAVPAATATAAGRYLQAGAYSSRENAELQRSAIEQLGFRASVQLEGNLLRVLVGPYGDTDLEAARSSLARQGIDSIPR
jgi:cell division septation protein DedD